MTSPSYIIVMKNRDEIYDIIIFSIMVALAYVGTFIMIPLPTGGKIHLGNLVCIISALLLGGVKGGLIGSIGMGLNDLHFFLDTPSTIIQTIIMKFFMGLICGLIFNLIRNKNTSKKTNVSILLSISAIFMIGFILTLVGNLNGGITVNGTTTNIHVLVPISCILFSFLFILATFFINSKTRIYQHVLIATSIATLFNIFGEFLFRIILNVFIDNYGFMPSVVMSLAKIPATLLTGILTTLAATILFPLLSKALSYKLNDRDSI